MQSSEIMAGSQYHQTTMSLLKTGLVLNYHITIFFCFVDKNHHIHRKWINPFPRLLASFYLKKELDVI